MKPLLELIEKGGPVMIAIIVLSIVLYAHCFHLLLTLREARRRLRHDAPYAPEQAPALRRQQTEVVEIFRQQRLVLGAMIAAAPLLGLLGTVSGMVTTFESLSTQAGQKSMEGLAGGISEVLVATESGLAVAIPALLLVSLAHRELQRHLRELNQMEEGARPGVAP